MMKRTMVGALSLAFAVSAFGAISKEHAEFAKGPTQLLLTKEERKQWEGIKTDAQARAFIDLFWARRDPTPGTAPNEYRDAITQRMQRADSLYGTARLRGSATDQGKVYVLLGPPTTISRGGAAPGTGVRAPGSTFGQPTNLDPTSVQGNAPSEIWTYEQSKVELKLGQPTLKVAFSDQYASNDWKMERIAGTDYATAFDRITRLYIANPELTTVPVYADAGAPSVASVTAPAPTTAPAKSTLKSDALRSAIDAARAAKATSESLYLSYGEFVTPAGEYYVPVQLYVPKSAGLAAGSNVTFFGAVENETGRVAEIEENVTLTASGESSFYARTLTIPAGSYTGTFGLAKDGKPIAVVSKPMKLEGRDKSASAISSMVLSNNVYVLAKPQLPTDPFSFGGIKVVPKGDASFRKADDLWYFFELQNPAMDAATGQPKMSTKLTIKGKAKDGTEVNRTAPAAITDVQALKGVEGHYILAQSLPLASFQPGDYTIVVKVNDMAMGKSYEFEEAFRIVE